MRIELQGIRKVFGRTHALRGVDLGVASGEFVALMGPSGCGKTTLLSIIGLLSQPTGGRFLLDGREASGLSRREQARWRAGSLGFIFQRYNLLPREPAWRNVMLPLVFRNTERGSRRAEVARALEDVGLTARAGHLPNELSGGEQQRVGIARALVNRPRLLLADEPTGNLDSGTGAAIMQLIERVAATYGATIVMATHDRAVAAHAARVVEMKDGCIVGERRGERSGPP